MLFQIENQLNFPTYIIGLSYYYYFAEKLTINFKNTRRNTIVEYINCNHAYAWYGTFIQRFRFSFFNSRKKRKLSILIDACNIDTSSGFMKCEFSEMFFFFFQISINSMNSKRIVGEVKKKKKPNRATWMPVILKWLFHAEFSTNTI